MKYSILIGSYARGDFNENSDCDVLLVDTEESEFEISALSTGARKYVGFINYDEKTFLRLYEIGSLFLYHVLQEGVVIEGDRREWSHLRSSFVVQSNFINELNEIVKTTDLLSKTAIFGGKFLTPLVNAFTELKNACIFSLAHHGIYEFNKTKCFERSFENSDRYLRLKSLKSFYDYSVRSLDVQLPFDPNDGKVCATLLKMANTMAKELQNACK